MTPTTASYVVVSPIRDEEQHIESTIHSMIRQTVLPKEWIIVDDGSTDATGRIIDEYASRYPWIQVVHRPDRGYRKAGGGVIEAFYAGYRTVTCSDWDFLVKLDGDLTFESTYFEECFREFDRDRVLGVGGGVICYLVEGQRILEGAPTFHVRGATKIYRKACWNEIGGLLLAPGWDTFDEIKANSLGWATRSFKDLHLLHHRETGSADGSWPTCIKYGRANYICGYHPLFMLCKVVVRLREKPYIFGSMCMMYGFLTGYLKRIPRVDDQKTIAYLRRQQFNRLCGRETIWK
jgi:poly-beta-1,6-N-acetyl-D-glucosamine synthase